MNHQYKVGDKVRVIHTDYPEVVPINSIQTILEIHGTSYYLITGKRLTSWGSGWTFYSREIEPYKEEEVMNDKIEVGDIVEIISIPGLLHNHKDIGKRGIVTKINSSGTKSTYFIDSTNYVFAESSLKLVSKGNKMKEIIGYNIKDKKYGQAAMLLAEATTSVDSFLDYMPRAGHKVYATNLQRAGVLDLWFEPVYKSSEVVVKLSGSRTATLKDKSQATILLRDGSKVPVTALNIATTLKAFDSLGQIAGYNVGVKEFNLGCQSFTITDLQAVDKAFKDFQ